MGSVTAVTPSLYELQKEARVYPGYLLPRSGTALALFAAGYHGWNDCIHFVRHNMTADCVDTDADKLWEMATVYPGGWAFHVEDAWEFAERAAEQGRTWDVVSVDTFLGEATERSLETLGLWTSLARQLVTVTVRPGAEVPAVDGWSAFLFPRTRKASWLVLERG